MGCPDEMLTLGVVQNAITGRWYIYIETSCPTHGTFSDHGDVSFATRAEAVRACDGFKASLEARSDTPLDNGTWRRIGD